MPARFDLDFPLFLVVGASSDMVPVSEPTNGDADRAVSDTVLSVSGVNPQQTRVVQSRIRLTWWLRFWPHLCVRCPYRGTC